MYIERVDKERYKVKVNTNLGEQIKIVNRSQLYWLSYQELNDICNKQININF